MVRRGAGALKYPGTALEQARLGPWSAGRSTDRLRRSRLGLRLGDSIDGGELRPVGTCAERTALRGTYGGEQQWALHVRYIGGRLGRTRDQGPGSPVGRADGARCPPFGRYRPNSVSIYGHRMGGLPLSSSEADDPAALPLPGIGSSMRLESPRATTAAHGGGSAGATDSVLRQGRVAYLDGVRAIAVVVVILYHAGNLRFPIRWARGGYIGVDIFFVLSGYVITFLLIRRQPTVPVVVRYRTFMWARFRRLYPALIATLVCVLGAVGVGWHPTPAQHLTNVALWCGIAAVQLTAFAFAMDVSRQLVTGATWTLSCEWLFYAVWPFALFAIAQRRRAWLITTAIAVAIYVAAFAIPPRVWWVLPPARMAEILVGASLALRVASVKPASETAAGRRRAAGYSLIGLAVIIYWTAVVQWGPDYYAYRQLGCIAVVLATVALLAGGLHSPLVAAALSARPLAAVGRGSYSLYLVHLPWMYAFGRPEGSTVSIGRLGLATAGIIGSAWVIHRFFERPYFQSHRDLRTPLLRRADA